MKQWINVAIIGTGKIYEDGHRNTYINPYSTNNALIAICDQNEQRAKEQFNWMKQQYEKRLAQVQKKNQTADIERIKYALDNMKVFFGPDGYTKMLDQLEGTLDLVDNCTHGRFHIPLAVQALEHGYNAMAEKPPGLNWWDVKRIYRAEQKSKKCYQLMENVCFEKPILKMREIIANNNLGKVQSIKIMFGHNGPYEPYTHDENGLPHFISPLLSGGGVVQDLLPHGISRAFWPLGPGAKVLSCETTKLERRKNPRVMSGINYVSKVEDWSEASLECFDARTKSNFTMDVTGSWCGNPGDDPAIIKGEKGELKMKKHLIRFTYEPCITSADGKDTFFSLDKDNWEPHNSHIRETQIFCDNLLKGQPSLCPAEYSLRLQEVLSIQFFSKLMKKRVTIEEMERWGEEIANKAGDEQKAVDEIALKLCSAVDFL